MRDILPIHIENRELPKDSYKELDNSSSGYVNVLFLASIIMTIINIVTIIMVRK